MSVFADSWGCVALVCCAEPGELIFGLHRFWLGERTIMCISDYLRSLHSSWISIFLAQPLDSFACPWRATRCFKCRFEASAWVVDYHNYTDNDSYSMDQKGGGKSKGMIDSMNTHPGIYLARAGNYVDSSHELLLQSAITLIPHLSPMRYSWNSLLLAIILLHHNIPKYYDSAIGVPCASDRARVRGLQ